MLVTLDKLAAEGYTVVWSGKDELLPERETKVSDTWVGPKRMWNRAGVSQSEAREAPLEDNNGVNTGRLAKG